MAHEIPVRALVDVVLGLPRAPRLDGVLDPRADLARRAWRRGAARSSADAQRSEKPWLSPSRRRNAARIVASSTSSGTDERTETRPDPKVRAPPSSSRISGRISPYSGRGASSMTIATSPETPSTDAQQLVRRVEAQVVPALPVGGGQRVDAAAPSPVSVVNVVSTASEPGR